MAHIAGIGPDWHTSGGTNLHHCAVALVTGQINNVNSNGGPCQWEIEVMLALYGVRSGPPSLSKQFITGLTGATGPTSIAVGGSGTLGYTDYRFDRANGLMCGLTERDMCAGEYVATATRTGSISWQSTNSGVASVTPSGATTTVTGVSAGTSTITGIPGAVTAYDLATDRTASRSIQVTAVAPPPPSNISASSITTSSATINWTNGDATATTVVEYQYTGQSGWTQVTASAGATSKGITGLAPGTTYSVRLHHVLGGLSSTTVTASNLFQTSPDPSPPSITNFATTHCELTSKGWPNITFSWSKSGNWTGTSWEMYWGSTPTGISLATSGPGTVTSTTKAISPVADHKYVFIRTVRFGVAGSWVALEGNPVDVTNGCDGIGDL